MLLCSSNHENKGKANWIQIFLNIECMYVCIEEGTEIKPNAFQFFALKNQYLCILSDPVCLS